MEDLEELIAIFVGAQLIEEGVNCLIEHWVACAPAGVSVVRHIRYRI